MIMYATYAPTFLICMHVHMHVFPLSVSVCVPMCMLVGTSNMYLRVFQFVHIAVVHMQVML